MHDLTERELVQGCLAEDRRCQEMLYERFAGRMYAVCLRYARHEMEAEDLMQDGFIRVFDRLKDFRMEGSLEGWVRRIMVHTAINQYRRKSHHNERIGTDQLPERSTAPKVLDQMGEREILALVSALPDGYRMVFNLYAIEGFDHAEIAEMMGCGESTSRSQLAKARRILQRQLETPTAPVHAGSTSH